MLPVGPVVGLVGLQVLYLRSVCGQKIFQKILGIDQMVQTTFFPFGRGHLKQHKGVFCCCEVKTDNNLNFFDKIRSSFFLLSNKNPVRILLMLRKMHGRPQDFWPGSCVLSKVGGLYSGDQLRSRSRCLDRLRPTFETCRDYHYCRDQIFFSWLRFLKLRLFQLRLGNVKIFVKIVKTVETN